MKRFNKKALLALPLSAAILLAACGGENDEANNENDSANEENNVTEEVNNDLASNETESDTNAADPDAPVATVNGEEIPMAVLQAQMMQIEQMFAQQGMDTEDEETQQLLMQFQQQLLEELITQEILLQEADQLNIEADEEDVNEAVEQELKQLKAQFEDEEQFEEALEMQELTMEEVEEDVRESYRERLKLEKLISLDHLDDDEISITEDDVREYYEQIALENPEIGEFEEVQDEMEEQVKEQQYMQQLREDADIEILI